MEKKETSQLPVSPQETQIQPPSFLDKIKIHKFKILGGVLGVFVFAGAVFGAYKLGTKQTQIGPQPTSTPTISPTPDETANWKTYTNTKYGYSIKHPASYLLEDFSAGTTHQIEISGVDFKVIIRVREGEETPYYLDQKSSGEVKLGSTNAKLYKFPNGFCEIGSCTPPFIAVVAYKNNQQYVLEFNEAALRKTELDWISNLMLSTFRFWEEMNWKIYEGQSSYYWLTEEGRFTLQYPPNICDAIERGEGQRPGAPGKLILCEGEDYKFTLDPSASGGGTPPNSEISQIQLGGITWERIFWKDIGFSSYDPSREEVGGLTFLFDVSYEKYSIEGEKLAEQILSTFRFLE